MPFIPLLVPLLAACSRLVSNSSETEVSSSNTTDILSDLIDLPPEPSHLHQALEINPEEVVAALQLIDQSNFPKCRKGIERLLSDSHLSGNKRKHEIESETIAAATRTLKSNNSEAVDFLYTLVRSAYSAENPQSPTTSSTLNIWGQHMHDIGASVYTSSNYNPAIEAWVQLNHLCHPDSDQCPSELK